MGIGFKHGGGGVKKVTLSVSIDPSGGGTATGGGRIKKKKTVTVTASPASGYIFGGWYIGGTLVSSSASYTFTIMANTSLVARFIRRYTISVSVNPSEGGVAYGGGIFNAGSTVTVSASPYSGYYWVGWYSNGVLVSSSQTYTFAASADISLEARFRLPVTGEPGTSYQDTLSGYGYTVYYYWPYGAPKSITIHSLTTYNDDGTSQVARNLNITVPYGTEDFMSYATNANGATQYVRFVISWSDSYIGFSGPSIPRIGTKTLVFTANY